MRFDTRTELEANLTDVLRRLRLARDADDADAELVLSGALDYGLAKWEATVHGVKVAP